MTRIFPLLKRLAGSTVSAYGIGIRFLGFLVPMFDLFVRLYMASMFWKGGMIKITNWVSTVMLFTLVYDVPYLPPEFAAGLSAAVELGGSFLLAVGLAGRFGAFSLFALNIVASISYGQLSEAALQEAFYWGVLLMYLVLHGPGVLSLDALIGYLLRRRGIGTALRVDLKK